MNGEDNKAYAVIMAGGKGERFWPLSTEGRPKQLISLFGGKTLLQMAVERIEAVFGMDNILVVTNAALVDATRAALPHLSPANVIGEPIGRDTAAACAAGAAIAMSRGGDAVAVLTADQIISDAPVFRQTLVDALALCREQDVLITLGVRPAYAATGFGYIEIGPALACGKNTEFVKAERFVEKPDEALARAYVDGGRHLWNAGMFVWSVQSFNKALALYVPRLCPFVEEIAAAGSAVNLAHVLERLYADLPKISIDYALMEHADNIVTAVSRFGWDDVGAWPALQNHFPEDQDGNTILGDCVPVESSGNVVFSQGRLTALLGVNNMVVVHSDKATLVCDKARAQDLKSVVSLLRANEKYKPYI